VAAVTAPQSPLVYIASDHAGFDLKKLILEKWPQGFQDFVWKDFGPANADRVDYPDFANHVCKALIAQRSAEAQNFGTARSRAILICGSGQGMAMAANRYRQIRAAMVWSLESVELARAHNDANVLCIGARLIEPTLAVKLVEAFLTKPFEGGRHLGRLAKLDA